MADTTLTIVFPEKQLQFEYNSFAGCFGYDDNPASFSAAIGETYRVMWGDDGVFDVTVFDASAVFPGALGMGNGTPFGFDGNGEPFIIVFIDGGILFLSLVDQVPTARSVSVHKVSDGSGGADSEGISVLPLASYEFTPSKNEAGVTVYVTTFLPFSLEAWRKYRVSWNGDETELMAGILSDGVVYLGNAGVAGGADTGEQFLICSESAYGIGYTVTRQEGAYHEVGIWQTKDVGIILRDHTGAEMGCYGVEGLHVDTTDGGTKLFVDSDLVPESVETTVELDFSGGAMEVSPADGQAFSKVAVPVPENLLPENIAEGVNIAGIIGALAAGGSKGIIATSGSSNKIPNVDSDWEIQHNLGVVPDIVVVLMVNAAYSSITSGRIVSVYGVSEKMYSTNRFPFGMAANLYANAYMKSAFYYIDGTEGYIHDANEMTVKIGNSSVKLQGNRPYMWFAIGGLT